MRIPITISSLIVVALALLVLPATARQSDSAPRLYDDTGSYHREVSTSNPTAQKYVDQGLRFLYAFHYGEANRAFKYAAALDPKCVMAWWGVAASNGPHINDPSVSPEQANAALDALHRAQAVDEGPTPVEKALVQAALKRFAVPAPTDRSKLDLAYADAMRQVWKDYPNDADVGALFAEAMMDLRPWNQWTHDQKPQPGTEEVLATLDTVLKLDPSQPLGNHLTIHAWEASPHPERAAAAAHRLRNMMPGVGHMVHMPSHIDVRLGHWKEAILANERAVAADRTYVKTHKVKGIFGIYMGHNFHMLAFAAMMCGDSRRALAAIDELISRLSPDWFRENPPFADGSGFLAMPLEVRLRFGRWNEVLAEPEPPASCPVARAMRHYARGVAFAAKRQFGQAMQEQRQFEAARKRISPEAIYGLSTAAEILTLASHVFAGELQFQSGKRKAGLAELRKAVKCEDALHYDEPPDWIQPTRHALGAALMTSGKFAEAERVYREDLAQRPENGWSLYGLARSLERQGKKAVAQQARSRLARVWKESDIKLSTSCMCLPGI